MKKHLAKLIVILICFSFGKIYAQNLVWGKLLNSKSSVYRPHVFGEDKSSIYVISYERSNIMFEKFDKTSWEKVYSKKVSAKSNKYSDDSDTKNSEEKNLEVVTFLSNQFIVFTSDFDDDNR